MITYPTFQILFDLKVIRILARTPTIMTARRTMRTALRDYLWPRTFEQHNKYWANEWVVSRANIQEGAPRSCPCGQKVCNLSTLYNTHSGERVKIGQECSRHFLQLPPALAFEPWPETIIRLTADPAGLCSPRLMDAVRNGKFLCANDTKKLFSIGFAGIKKPLTPQQRFLRACLHVMLIISVRECPYHECAGPNNASHRLVPRFYRGEDIIWFECKSDGCNAHVKRHFSELHDDAQQAVVKLRALKAEIP